MRTFVQRRWRAGGGMGLLLLLLLACTPATRYKVLNRLFDGVPNGKPKETAKPHRSTSPLAGLRAPIKPRPTPLPIVSTHKPVVQRQCRACHETGGGFVPIAMDATLCDKCHKEQRQKEGWNHGPINLGTCIPCHRAHESPYPHLLDRPLPDVCLICHKDDLERREIYHQVPNVNQCTACHDPHRMY